MAVRAGKRERIGGWLAAALLLTGDAAAARDGPASKPDVVVLAAVQAARAKLKTAECRAIFTDFTDSSGRPLQERLDALQESGESYLERLTFFNGRSDGLCRRHETLAYTHPGNPVVYFCGRKLADRVHTNRGFAAVIVLHEALHSLGLEENPPSSEEITYRVMARCGS
jgi:hypothetical protein